MNEYDGSLEEYVLEVLHHLEVVLDEAQTSRFRALKPTAQDSWARLIELVPVALHELNSVAAWAERIRAARAAQDEAAQAAEQEGEG